jgi:hypothetical protein
MPVGSRPAREAQKMVSGGPQRPFVFRAVQYGQFGLVSFQPASQGEGMTVKHGKV